jgi:hypothetical protein
MQHTNHATDSRSVEARTGERVSHANHRLAMEHAANPTANACWIARVPPKRDIDRPAAPANASITTTSHQSRPRNSASTTPGADAALLASEPADVPVRTSRLGPGGVDVRCASPSTRVRTASPPSSDVETSSSSPLTGTILPDGITVTLSNR